MHPKLCIQAFQVLKLQDLQSQQNIIYILTMHQFASTYIWQLRPPMPEVDVEWKLVVMVASTNHF